jgi:hypothetical protein
MSVELKNKDEVIRKLSEIAKIGDKDIMKDIGENAVKLIQDRTTSGQDVDHQTFHDYSNYYKKKSGKADPPDLKKSGAMLRAMKVYVTDALTVVVRVVGGKEYNIGMQHQAGKQGMPQRKWFGVSHTTDKNKLLTKLKKLLMAKVMREWDK